jgi:hypothetical protein
MKAQRRSIGLAVRFLWPCREMGWVVNATPRLLYLRETDPLPTVFDAGWAPERVWTGAENLAHTGFNPWTVQFIASRYTD